MKKRAVFLSVAVIAIWAGLTIWKAVDKVPGFSSEGRESEEAEAGKKEKETIVLRYMGWGASTEKEATKKVIERFEREHSGIKVEYIHEPKDYNIKLSMRIAEGNEPDVAMVEGKNALELAVAGKLTNIWDFAEEDPEFNLDGVIPQAIYWWDQDKACGINSALEVYTLFYNRELVKEAGIEVPFKTEDAWSWEEFIYAARKLTVDENGHNGLEPEFDPGHIRQYGLRMPVDATANILSCLTAYSKEGFLTEDGTRLNLVGSKTEEAIQKMADLINVYHVAPNPVEMKSLPESEEMLDSGKVAMVLEGQWCLMQFSHKQTNVGLGVLPQMFGSSVTISLGEPIVVFQSTDHPREAWELQKAFMDPEYVIDLILEGLWMPVLDDWYEKGELLDMWAKNNPAHPEEYVEAVLKPAMEHSVPSLNYTVKNLSGICDVLEPVLRKIWMGEQSAKEGLAMIEGEANQQVQGEYAR